MRRLDQSERRPGYPLDHPVVVRDELLAILIEVEDYVKDLIERLGL